LVRLRKWWSRCAVEVCPCQWLD